MRIGHGIDVHQLVNSRELMIGGVKIPFEKGLLGHSDADVLLHAIMDALLGAAGLYDIGKHFPDSDEQYRNISSVELLKKVNTLLLKHQFCISNIDATVIAQVPRLSPYIDQMRETIANVLSLPVSCVNIKATTSEKLGFTGRQEGIQAEAVCLLYEKTI